MGHTALICIRMVIIHRIVTIHGGVGVGWARVWRETMWFRGFGHLVGVQRP